MSKQKRVYRKKKYAKSKADKALQLAKYAIERQPVPERGIIENQLTQAALSQTLQFLLLNGLIRGDDYDNRDKRVIRLESMSLNWIIQHDVLDTIACVTRLMLVWDKQSNGAIFTSNDLLSDITPIDNINSQLNLSNRKRFQVLKDIRIDTTSAGSNQVKHGSMYINLRKKMTVYNTGNAGTVADISTGSLYLVYVCTNVLTAPELSIRSRIRFFDN